MRYLRPFTIGTILLLAQLSAFAGELAVLRNGFSLRFERKEQNGTLTRLYTSTGFLDIATDQIASFEQEEPPLIQPEPVIQPGSTIQPQPTTQPQSTIQPQPMANGVAPQPAPVVDLDQLVRDASSRNHLDPDFVASVIRAESNFKPRAISPKGALGLMQLMPGTAARLGVTDPFDPKANVEAGTAHLSALLNLYHDDPIKALAAYNAGAHRVDQYHGVPPYRETRAYVAKIVRDFNAKKTAQMKAAANANMTARKGPAPAKAVHKKVLHANAGNTSAINSKTANVKTANTKFVNNQTQVQPATSQHQQDN